MALKLHPPGTRSETSFVARGWVNGRLYEYSLKTADQRIARRSLREFEAKIRAGGPQAVGAVTFGEAAARYQQFRPLSREGEADLAAIVAEIGRRRLRELTPADLHDVANRLKPRASGSWKNRHVLTPAGAVWHHAAETGLCDHVKIKRFHEEKPKTKALSQEDAARLIAATQEGTLKRLLLLWLFHQGMRISHTLAVEWENIDLTRGTVAHRERKGHRQHDYVFPLHQEVLDELARVPPHMVQNGRVFRDWSGKSAVYYWLRPLCAELGIDFTPHMARHSRGTWLSDGGASLRTIMEALGHASEKSSLRYQHGNIDVVRAVGAKISLKGTGS